MIVSSKEGKRTAKVKASVDWKKFILRKTRKFIGRLNYKPKHLESKAQADKRKALERKALIVVCVLSLCSIPFVDNSLAISPDPGRQVVPPERLAEAHLVIRDGQGDGEVTLSDLATTETVVALPITDDYHVKVGVKPEGPSEVLTPARVALALNVRRPMLKESASAILAARAGRAAVAAPAPASMGLGPVGASAGLGAAGTSLPVLAASVPETEPESAVVIDLSIDNMVAKINTIEAEELAAEQARLERERLEAEKLRIGQAQLAQGYLVTTDKPDASYTGVGVIVQGQDRDTLERLVMGEAGNQGFAGAALVAQCIRDAIVFDGYKSVEEVRQALGYTGKLVNAPNQTVKDAVSYIFDKGQSAVQHRILYFYSANGGWHETQNFIVELGAHRFFDRWW